MTGKLQAGKREVKKMLIIKGWGEFTELQEVADS
jgi:hypothetical protein